MKDLKLGVDGDLELEAGVDLVIVEAGACVRQRIALSLGTGIGEAVYFLDFGIPFDEIFAKVEASTVAAVLRAALSAVEGVERVDAFDWTFDAGSRQFGSRFTVTTIEAESVEGLLTLDGDEGASVRFVGLEYL